VGEALEEDSQFYNDDIWAEDESDDSYEAEEEKPDVFDSDFNDTEDDDESDDGEESDTRRNERIDSRAKSGGRYKEPGKPKLAARKNTVTGLDSAPKSSSKSKSFPEKRMRCSELFSSADIEQSRSVRSSTKSKTEQAEKIRNILAVTKPTRIMKSPIKHKFSQKELLLDALLTEVSSQDIEFTPIIIF
jgi:hypothetical protein